MSKVVSLMVSGFPLTPSSLISFSEQKVCVDPLSSRAYVVTKLVALLWLRTFTGTMGRAILPLPAPEVLQVALAEAVVGTALTVTGTALFMG